MACPRPRVRALLRWPTARTRPAAETRRGRARGRARACHSLLHVELELFPTLHEDEGMSIRLREIAQRLEA